MFLFSFFVFVIFVHFIYFALICFLFFLFVCQSKLLRHHMSFICGNLHMSLNHSLKYSHNTPNKNWMYFSHKFTLLRKFACNLIYYIWNSYSSMSYIPIMIIIATTIITENNRKNTNKQTKQQKQNTNNTTTVTIIGIHWHMIYKLTKRLWSMCTRKIARAPTLSWRWWWWWWWCQAYQENRFFFWFCWLNNFNVSVCVGVCVTFPFYLNSNGLKPFCMLKGILQSIHTSKKIFYKFINL